jgi:hypothetical protein
VKCRSSANPITTDGLCLICKYGDNWVESEHNGYRNGPCVKCGIVTARDANGVCLKCDVQSRLESEGLWGPLATHGQDKGNWGNVVEYDRCNTCTNFRVRTEYTCKICKDKLCVKCEQRLRTPGSGGAMDHLLCDVCRDG